MELTKHQKAIVFISEMEIGKTYNLNEDQKQIFLDLIFDSAIVIPTKPTDKINYWFKFGNNMKIITKNHNQCITYN